MDQLEFLKDKHPLNVSSLPHAQVKVALAVGRYVHIPSLLLNDVLQRLDAFLNARSRFVNVLKSTAPFGHVIKALPAGVRVLILEVVCMLDDSQ
jgi:hypothetical protein